MNTILKKNIAAIKELCENHHIKNLYAFGSVTDHTFSNESDIDLLYEFDYGNFNINTDAISLIPFDPFLEFNLLKEKLEALFDRKVDLIPLQKFRNPIFQEKVEQTKTLVYGRERYQEIFA